jgi:RNA polymerase subunit RPABC4/transcription elongation factor Spt4
MFVSGDTCPSCKGTSFTTSWQGRLYIADKERSTIAEEVSTPVKGEYAIKVR